MPDIVLIAAVGQNRVIGKDNALLWNLPEDMAHFRKLTAGQTVIMGRKTWESLPERFRPLPGRLNIVLSRQTDFSAPGAQVVQTLGQATALATQLAPTQTQFVIGGEQIYRLAMPHADRLEITAVALAPDGDAYFPEISKDHWVEVASIDMPPLLRFVTYQRTTGQGHR
ncbi:MAG: dihydrofolate reductase [Azonexus sp.]|nr:dihydrofolate reductase [Azonexus sp.]